MPNTQRVSISISPELELWLRERAFQERISISEISRFYLEAAREAVTQVALSQPFPLGDRADAGKLTDEEAMRALPLDESEQRRRIRDGEPWSAVCLKRLQHVAGEKCSHCGGVRP